MYQQFGDEEVFDDGLDWDGSSVSYDAPAPMSAAPAQPPGWARQYIDTFEQGLLAVAPPTPAPAVPATTLAPMVSTAPYNYTPALALIGIAAFALLAKRIV